MASPAQILANRANAARSTGPRTPEGKARSSRNASTHGLAAGLFLRDEADEALADALFAEIQPSGVLELELLEQFVDSALRLRRIRAAVRQLAGQYNGDPLLHPEAEAAIRQLNRYRAHAEMCLYRSLRTLRQMQQQRLARETQIRQIEAAALPPLANPVPYKTMKIDGRPMNAIDRAVWDHFWRIQRAAEARFAKTNPTSAGPPEETGITPKTQTVSANCASLFPI